MVEMYCNHHHDAEELCPTCLELIAYADRRLDLCPYGGAKPACTQCPIHCYRPGPLEEMRQVMQFSGPRMLKKHPWLAIMHLIDAHRPVPPLPKRHVSGRDGEE